MLAISVSIPNLIIAHDQNITVSRYRGRL